MKPLTLFAAFFFSVSSSVGSAQSLGWNDANISDGPCTYPPALVSLAPVFNTLAGVDKLFRVYLPFGNAAYFRWVHQKINGGVPATNQSQVFATKPRVSFPFIGALPFWAVGRVDVYAHQPVDKWYFVQAIPKNLPLLTDLEVNIVSASPGSAPNDFGGTNIPSRYVWADFTALVEWHCFAGNVQVFNVISLTPTLTPQQISSISTFLQGYGFQPGNFMTMPY